MKTIATKTEELDAEESYGTLTGYTKAVIDFASWVFRPVNCRDKYYFNHIDNSLERLVTYFKIVETMLDCNLNTVIAVLGNMKMDVFLLMAEIDVMEDYKSSSALHMTILIIKGMRIVVIKLDLLKH